jgi:hypothetical protein
VRPIPLIQHRGAVAAQTGQAGEDSGQLATQPLVDALEAVRGERAQVPVQGVHEQPVGRVALQLRRAPAQHLITACLGEPLQLGQQAGLADAGLARQHEPAPVAGLDLG